MENGEHGRQLEVAVGPVGPVLGPEYGVVTVHRHLGEARVASKPINKNGHAIQTAAQHVGHKHIFHDIYQSYAHIHITSNIVFLIKHARIN